MNCTPYRKDDLDGRSDRANLLFFVRRGFVAIKVDVRGTGSSEGVAIDEYTEEEQNDYYEVVEWAAAQEWCNGKVGAFGLSYSGFNAIQVAALAPPSLKAISAIGATDDRYTDDVHFYGGALSAFELGHYQSRMLALNALPPDADLRDESVRAAWLDRLEQTPAWVTRWMTEQRDGPYWRVGSLRPGYERIVCPVLLIVGLHDGYSAATLRTAREVAHVPWQVIVAPWAHCWPHEAWPGPRCPALEAMAAWLTVSSATIARTRWPCRGRYSSSRKGAGSRSRPIRCRGMVRLRRLAARCRKLLGSPAFRADGSCYGLGTASWRR